MQIHSVISHLGAWNRIQSTSPHLINELEQGIAALPPIPQNATPHSYRLRMGSFDPLCTSFTQAGWEASVPFSYGRWNHQVDFVKQNVALEVATGNLTSALTFFLLRC